MSWDPEGVRLHPLRIASLSKIFPTLMLYKLWEDGRLDSLDAPLDKFLDAFTIKNPLGGPRSGWAGLTLRRMASQLSGKVLLSGASPTRTSGNRAGRRI